MTRQHHAESTVRVQNASGVDLDQLLARPLFAHLATASAAGPRDSPVWFCWEDGALWIVGDTRTDTFPARVAADPRCAIGIVDFDAASGRVAHVSLRGSATVVPLDAARRDRLFARYLGSDRATWDPRFVAGPPAPYDVFVRFEPADILVRDQSYRTPYVQPRR